MAINAGFLRHPFGSGRTRGWLASARGWLTNPKGHGNNDDDQQHELAPVQVESILEGLGVHTLGRVYRFFAENTSTMNAHPEDAPVGSLILADLLTRAKSGIGDWFVSGLGNDLMGSVVLPAIAVETVLDYALAALQKAITTHTSIETKGHVLTEIRAAELFVLSNGREDKVAGLLATTREDGTIVLGFSLHVRGDKELLAEHTSLEREGHECGRVELLGTFLAALEKMLWPER